MDEKMTLGEIEVWWNDRPRVDKLLKASYIWVLGGCYRLAHPGGKGVGGGRLKPLINFIPDVWVVPLEWTTTMNQVRKLIEKDEQKKQGPPCP